MRVLTYLSVQPLHPFQAEMAVLCRHPMRRDHRLRDRPLIVTQLRQLPLQTSGRIVCRPRSQCLVRLWLHPRRQGPRLRRLRLQRLHLAREHPIHFTGVHSVLPVKAKANMRAIMILILHQIRNTGTLYLRTLESPVLTRARQQKTLQFGVLSSTLPDFLQHQELCLHLYHPLKLQLRRAEKVEIPHAVLHHLYLLVI
jgi:hypothetical protein